MAQAAFSLLITKSDHQDLTLYDGTVHYLRGVDLEDIKKQLDDIWMATVLTHEGRQAELGPCEAK